MSSAPFQSRVFRFLSQQRLRLRDRLQILWRQARTTAVWSAQIALYPIYAAVQTTRLLVEQTSRAAQKVFPGLGAGDRKSGAIALPTDTPIQNTLRGILAWVTSDGSLEALAERRPEMTPEKLRFAWFRELLAKRNGKTSSRNPAQLKADALAPRKPASVEPASVEKVSNRTVQPLEVGLQKRAPSSLQSVSVLGVELSAAELQKVPTGLVPAIASLQGIASLLVNRSLVLVGTGNVIYDVLSLEQQAALQQRMSWEMATYWRVGRAFLRENHHQHVPNIPSPGTRSFLPPSRSTQKNLLPPVRGFLQLMDWMQRSPVAIATNLFQEAALELHFGNPTAEPDSWSLSDSLTLSLETLLNNEPNSVAQASARPALQGRQTTVPQLPQQRQRKPTHPLARTSAPGRLVNPFDDIASASEPVVPEETPPLEPLPSPKAELTPANGNTLSQPTPIPHITPYIETDATLVGYEQHPLERLLKWLDSGMLWLEKRWELFWKWMMNRSRQE